MAAETVILQRHLPWVPDPAKLPGTAPVGPNDWLRVDEAYAGQMALRDALLAHQRDRVYAALPMSAQAEAEVLAAVLDLVRGWPGFSVMPDHVQRPDGVIVPLDGADPALVTAGRLVQEDLCIMQDMGQGEYGLTAAVLCFPASWTLAEKLGHPLTRIHVPVAEYDANIAARVERLFRGVRAGHPLCRFNFLGYEDPSLFTPGPEAGPRRSMKIARYIRSERQSIRRLPETGAALFAIHTYMVETARLDRDTYDAARGAITSQMQFPPWQGPAQGPSRP